MMHETASARWSMSRAVPVDLHSLVPVPYEVLRLGLDDPVALRWMWEHWGTTWVPLRRLEVVRNRAMLWELNFFSADWTPWPVMAKFKDEFGVNVRIKVSY